MYLLEHLYSVVGKAQRPGVLPEGGVRLRRSQGQILNTGYAPI